ncbi:MULTISPECIES: hypothetical protein [Paraburkholderia]|uniref:Bro-N domain-containing protein n=2 Tax=Paraburkholderia TaxID=1822464 RepID=A0AAP5EZM8_9BURK|nr:MULTISPECIES: hypothetical protein [Paraburkholderia]MCX4149774.1 hypothetical protein [Paraburkholderia madseniana]MCX4175101.1 hypothetical protein [Paraburkholderia madseniana]MDN7152710.1 hypothetical protein [Paraburkholderia sp. WS6]MDQ6411592.1 hypothetical protein [Paraburkholderia madseniana]MDQ6463101.1 hypothetical protein [Paraburkholderia madseniana]
MTFLESCTHGDETSRGIVTLRVVEMSQFEKIVYVCRVSGQRLHVRHDGNALWMPLGDAARLLGKRPAQLAKSLKYLRLNREIDEAADIKETNSEPATADLLLNHRAVISLGYHLNFGRVAPFRDWCSETLQARQRILALF